MRFLDLAVAALIGTAALTGMVAWDPAPADAYSRRLHLQSALRDDLAAFVQGKGAVWLLRSPRGTVCSAVDGMSNSTVGISVTLGELTCGRPPPPGAVAAELDERLGSEKAAMVEWSLA